MLPSSEQLNPDTMQTGELERAGPEEAPPHANMTVTTESPQPQSLLPPPLITAVPTNAEYKFKHDNDQTDTTASSDVEADLSDAEGYVVHNKLYQQQKHSQLSTTSSTTSGCYQSGSTNDHQTNESVRSWLQRITAMQQEIQRKQTKLVNSHGLNSTSSYQQSQQQTPTVSRVVKYQDLPYMGEMTLDNSKPRRGRKPKKADICHLIYKNYGTIFPGTPRNLVDSHQEAKKSSSKPAKEQSLPEPVQRTNVQNRIISSLLEKRLTQESLRNKELLTTKSESLSGNASKPNDQDEPLNLCIRDLNQLKIRLLRKHGNVYESEVKSEPASEDDDVEFVDESPSPESVTRPPGLSPAASDVDAPFQDVRVPGSGDMTAPGGYVYWPNAGVFIHPMALHSQLMYYQRLAAGSSYTLPGEGGSSGSGVPRSPSLDTNSTTTREFRKLIPKHLSRISQQQEKQTSPTPTEDGTERVTTPGSNSGVSGNEARIKRVATQPHSAPTKRKRSAIFIPPIPAENQTNPATEVSICKFKFTGGAKPSLQEKKMLSVDSGGNFRYYSGTGDKSMRGYEFFPRETLQQQAAASASSHGSGTGAFLQASGEKIPMLPTPGDQKTLPPDFMFAAEPPLQPLSPDLVNIGTPRHRKRKTRKSLQREKLEQTFKEKGFLIQTQQLESAEGATYCKFRQLRKFTRYLFRSWKDYLPGNVRELHEAERTDEEDGADSSATAATPPGAVSLRTGVDNTDLTNV